MKKNAKRKTQNVPTLSGSRMKTIIGTKLQKGFTLIEVLVVMGIMLIVGTIISAILTSSLRGANKTSSINTVTQNGNTAITEIENGLRFSQGFNGVAATVSNPISSTAFTLTCTQGQQYQAVEVTELDGGTTIYSCGATNIASTSAGLTMPFIDTNAGITVASCYFICDTYSVVNAPTIGIVFSLSKNSATTSVAENIVSPITFQTSVTLRNIAR